MCLKLTANSTDNFLRECTVVGLLFIVENSYKNCEKINFCCKKPMIFELKIDQILFHEKMTNRPLWKIQVWKW